MSFLFGNILETPIEFQYINLMKVSIAADASVAEEVEKAALHHRGGHERHQEGEEAQ